MADLLSRSTSPDWRYIGARLLYPSWFQPLNFTITHDGIGTSAKGWPVQGVTAFLVCYRSIVSSSTQQNLTRQAIRDVQARKRQCDRQLPETLTPPSAFLCSIYIRKLWRNGMPCNQATKKSSSHRTFPCLFLKERSSNTRRVTPFKVACTPVCNPVFVQ